MYINKKATILIYILVLISIVMIMAIVVLNNSVMLENSFSYQTIKSELASKIKEKGDMLANYDILVNSDGSGFTDIFGCPNNITMSGATVFSTGVVTDRGNSGSTFVCSGTYNSMNLTINFTNSGLNSFNSATWGADSTPLAGGVGDLSGIFTMYDSSGAILGTTISIPGTSYHRPDGCDDDFNNDNYNGTSGCDY